MDDNTFDRTNELPTSIREESYGNLGWLPFLVSGDIKTSNEQQELKQEPKPKNSLPPRQ